jgi:ElaA protein
MFWRTGAKTVSIAGISCWKTTTSIATSAATPGETELTASDTVPEERVRQSSFGDLTAHDLYGILRLRSEVFVVEQSCVYLDADGRDTEPETTHLWIERNETPVAYLRVLDSGESRRIGRVVTHPAARGSGLAGRLLQYVLDTTSDPWVLDAQSHLTGWYEHFGFVVSGDEFIEDGIPHVPMRRAAPSHQ